MPFESDQSTHSDSVLPAHSPADRAPDVVSLSSGNSLDHFFSSAGDSIPDQRPGSPFSLLAMLRYKWSMAAVFLVIAGIAIPAIWSQVVPTYETGAVVRVSPVGTRILFRTENNGMVPMYQSFLNSQVTIIRSRSVLDRVLDNPAVLASDWYREPAGAVFGTPLSPMERLLDGLVVTTRRNTEMIDVRMTARNAKDAKLIADTVVDKFKAYTEEALLQSDSDRLDTLRREMTGLRNQIDGLVETRSDIAANIGTTDPSARLAEASTQKILLESERNAMQRELDLLESDLSGMPEDAAGSAKGSGVEGEEIENGADEAGIEAADAPPRFFTDAEWRARHLGLARARHALETGRRQYGPSHPRIAALTRDLEYAESLVATREAQLTAQWRETPFTGSGPDGMMQRLPMSRSMLARRVERLTQHVSLMDDAIAAQGRKVATTGKIAKEVTQIDEELGHKRATYGLLRTRFEEITLEQNAPARISIAGYAVHRSRPSRDRRPLLSAMAVFGALAAALAIAYVRVVSDQTVREEAEVRRASSAPFLGQIPALPTTEDILSSCTPGLMEDLRMVRTALLERVNGAGHATILVTSSSPQAGKTSVSILLAQSLAMLGKKTLLVEADLRNPTVGRRLGLEGRAGLMSILTRKVEDSVAITRSKKFDFDVVLAGDSSVGFTPELLANGAMAETLAGWKKSYDVVLLDCPPVLPAADVRILGGLCDGTMMVLRSAHCKRTDVTESYALLAASGCRLLGTVLVGGTRRPGYSVYYDGYSGFSTTRPPLPQLEAAPVEEHVN